ncbi:glycosyltransferase family 8 protein [Phlebiopsis gigantea 11061_1 CR5-6]|uniref:Glycosyltransferase family 8 protein n=1 Tax=Phlebiopsis gigantea (strain 11061_1 CR5-6) TaxID=745531 RepID=A0A0C3PHF5_PHLG1|nr:glycosyltransferase family 8 protein [Phlebiopsis gigantea 11061_1 CR5-6]
MLTRPCARRGYALLAPHTPQQRLTPVSAIFAVLFLTSFLLNCVLVVRGWRSWTNPLDDYQGLKRYPLVENVLDRHPHPHANVTTEHAIATTLYNDAYAAAVATLGHSLRKVNTTARMVLLYFPDNVSPEALCLATSSGFVPQPVERIAPPDNGRGMNPHFADQYTKLSLWTLDTSPQPITSLVYLDSDTLVLRNFDELFTLPYTFAAAPDVYLDARGFTTGFNAGVMLLKPDSRLYRQLRASVPAARFPREMAEQAFLNQFFATDVLRLPYAYNGNIALKQRSRGVWDGIRAEMRVIHYTIVKPFVSHSWKTVPLDKMEERVQAAAQEHGGLFEEEMLHWGELWRETRSLYSREMEHC